MASSGRTIDIVVLGATGYTGKYCSEHIVKHLPTNLKWGIAGRSPDKLNALAAELQREGPDRQPPEILQVQMNEEELNGLARKVKVLINCVGPYHIYSSPVVAACANNGTHYLDVTAEIPWMRQMIGKHHETAKSNGTMLISALGMESVPSDLLSWAMASLLKEKYGVKTKEVTITLYDVRMAGASGGTMASLFASAKDMLPVDIKGTGDPHCLAAFHPPTTKPTPLLHRLLGVHSVPHIGTVTTSFSTAMNTPVVQRGGSLMPSLYDRDFRYWEYMRVPNALMGLITHFTIVTLTALILLPPTRWVMEKFVAKPGEGPSKASTEGTNVEFRGIASGEKDGKEVRATGKYVYGRDPYSMTGLLITEAAMVLLQDGGLLKEVGGGYLTPGMLGQRFIDRLEKAGLTIETEVIE